MNLKPAVRMLFQAPPIYRWSQVIKAPAELFDRPRSVLAAAAASFLKKELSRLRRD